MKVKVVNKSGLALMAYETKDSAGTDIRSSIQTILKPMQRKLVPTGIYLEIPKGFEAQVRPRSGLALKQGLTVLNAPGTIDSDYRGEVGVILINLGKEDVTITRGDRIAQLVFARCEQAEFEIVLEENLSETERGEGGFGHSGKQ